MQTRTHGGQYLPVLVEEIPKYEAEGWSLIKQEAPCGAGLIPMAYKLGGWAGVLMVKYDK